jgi:TusA-related sulfurtransferase
MRSNSDRLINTRTNQLISNLFDDSGTVASATIANKQKPLDKKQYKLNTVPAYVRTARIERVACPLHIIELTRNLKKIDVSETLRVIVGNHAVESELLSACHALGHKAVAIERSGHKELFVTRKN